MAGALAASALPGNARVASSTETLRPVGLSPIPIQTARCYSTHAYRWGLARSVNVPSGSKARPLPKTFRVLRTHVLSANGAAMGENGSAPRAGRRLGEKRELALHRGRREAYRGDVGTLRFGRGARPQTGGRGQCIRGRVGAEHALGQRLEHGFDLAAQGRQLAQAVARNALKPRQCACSASVFTCPSLR